MSSHWTILVTALLLLNGLASVRIIRDENLSVVRRITQLLVVWLVPVVGAVICLVLGANDVLAWSSRDRTAFVNNADASGEQSIAHSVSLEACTGDGGGGDGGCSD